MRVLRVRSLIGGALVALAVVAVACGGESKETDPSTAEPAAGPSALDVSIDDRSAAAEFSPVELSVSPGQKVVFNLTNKGVAVHNMRIAGADGEYGTEDDGVSDPLNVPSGDTASVEWTAPAEAGVYEFRCDLHPESVGTVVVR